MAKQLTEIAARVRRRSHLRSTRGGRLPVSQPRERFEAGRQPQRGRHQADRRGADARRKTSPRVQSIGRAFVQTRTEAARPGFRPVAGRPSVRLAPQLPIEAVPSAFAKDGIQDSASAAFVELLRSAAAKTGISISTLT